MARHQARRRGEPFDYLVEKGRLNKYEACIIIGRLCLTASHVRDSGPVHCDLIHGHVLLDKRCRIKLGDSGFTREFEKRSPLCTSCGTIGYASPDMLVCERVSITMNAIRARVESVTDRHFRGGHLALGIILYATLTGTPRLTTTKLS